MESKQQEKVLVEQVITVDSDEVADRRSGTLRLSKVSLMPVNKVIANATSENVYSGAEVRKWRKKCGLTMAALAATVGISEAYLSQLENGRRKGTVSTYKKIAQALNIHVSKLI